MVGPQGSLVGVIASCEKCQATPAEQQLLLFDTTVWLSIAYLLGEH